MSHLKKHCQRYSCHIRFGIIRDDSIKAQEKKESFLTVYALQSLGT